MDTSFRELQTLHERVNVLEEQVRQLMFALRGDSAADIDYIAMMTDIDLDREEVANVEEI